MRTLGKVMMGVSVGALALTVVGGVNAKADTGFTSSKTITGITKGSGVSFDAVKAGKSGATYNLKAKWDLYEADGTADLSNLKTAKDSYIAVQPAAGSVEIYKVVADTQKKFKATCDGSKITIQAEGKEVAAADMVNYEWRTENGTWAKFTATALDLSPYTMQGATLYIRHAGVASISPKAASTAETVKVGEDTITVKEIAANSFVAKEFKVKVPKKANAPAISVDYAAGTIKANKNAVTKTGTDMSSALGATWGTSKMSENFTIDNSKAGVLMMQIPADTEKKKPASKVAYFSWKASTAPTVNYTAPTLAAKSSDLIAGKVTITAKDSADVAKATFEIATKDTENTYEIFKSKDSKPDGKAIATLKAGATKAISWTSKKVSADTELIIRIAGDKKAGTLPSPFATTKFKAVYLQTPAATTAPS